MRAALLALRRLHPGRIVVAVPAAPSSTCAELRLEADEVVCATTPSPFFAVGQSYWDFDQTTDDEVRELLRAAARPNTLRTRARPDAAIIRMAAAVVENGVPPDETLFGLVGDARLVLIGESSHGTAEFYEARAQMTRKLIEQRGFCGVAVEADWPDAYRVNRYVRGHTTSRDGDATAEEALRGFQRFPTWMWRNTSVLDFVGWLRDHNDRTGAQAGFYGLDLYSLHRSMQDVIDYLDRVSPEAAARARERYACFDHADGDAQSYGTSVAFGAGESCEQEVLAQLADLQRHAHEYAKRDGLLAEDELFHAERNAVTVQSAERYYRSMVSGRVSTWNLRDQHMADTLDALADHLGRTRGEPAKLVVWAHNSHLGDARATEMGTRGELNLGRLVRERHPDECRLIGFTTYSGTVTAADDWGGPAERKVVRPGLPGSVEELLHEVGSREFLLWFDVARPAAVVLGAARLERAIGVIYRPETERQSHYFQARVGDQFDALIHIDETRALEPLERTGQWERGEAPETYPFAV
jgi:erythromycin esterase-like protein